MRFTQASGAGLEAAVLLALTTTSIAHSWIERAIRIDPETRKFVGKPGFPRGGNVRRMMDEGLTNDEEVIHRLPADGAYTGEENLNKIPFALNSPDETLEAAPGDFIAIMHLENGHVTIKDPGRPLNGGNIYLYGTSEPQDEEKLFDVHLAWNKDGTGGNGRGRLLGARNYDDLHCYESSGSDVGQQRVNFDGNHGAPSMACQSDLQLPDDLQPGDTYTIYWYWDWPFLNPDEIDMEGTKEGLFPWMGTFMRGEEDPNGFTVGALHTNESYASTIDIKIVDRSDEDFSSKLANLSEQDETQEAPQYQGMAIKEQLEDDNFAMPVPLNNGGGGGGNNGEPNEPPAASTSDAALPTPPGQQQPPPPPPAETVTVTKTQPAETIEKTVTVTAVPEPTDDPLSPVVSSTRTSPSSPCPVKSTKTINETKFSTSTVYEDEPTETPSATSGALSINNPSPGSSPSSSTSSPVIEPTPTPSSSNSTQPIARIRHRRNNWFFGEY